MKINEISKKIIIVVFIILFLYLGYKLFLFYIPFLIAYLISLIIEPLIKLLSDKTNLNRKTSSIIVMLIVFSFIITIIVLGIMGVVSEASNLLDKLNLYLDRVLSFVKFLLSNLNLSKFNISENIRTIIEKSSNEMISNFSDILKQILKSVLETIYSIPKIAIYFVITILATYFIISDKFYILDRIEHHIPRKVLDKILLKEKKLKQSLGKYLKAQGTIFIITFFVYLIGLYIMKIIGMNVRYPLIVAIIILVVDILPILGAGTIVIPWILISFLNNDKSLAFTLIGIYIFNLTIRQIIEPKIVSQKIGTHPIFTLIAMYTGFKLIGVFGLILGPIILIILKSIFSETIEDGILKSIFNK